MDRRQFVRQGLLGSATVLVGAELAAREGSPAGFDVPASEFDEVTVADLQKAMEAGRFTSESLARHYLARIEQLDRQGPNLCAVLETNPDALDVARALDRERREKGARGPLHGVPVLLKD